MDREQSQFIEEQTITDSDYLGFFGSSVNRKITWARFKVIILDFLAINFLIGSPSTLAYAQLMNLPANASVRTKGCLAIGDGGHGDYLVLDTAPTAIDGYSVAEMASGRYLVLQPVNGCVDIHQFGIDPANVRFALVRADAYCQATGIKLVGSGSGILSGIPILSAPYIDLSNFTITLEDDFGLTVGVIYEALPTSIDARANVSMRFDGNRDNQSSPVIAFRLTSCATPDSIFSIYGDNCNTLCNLHGNVERCEVHVKGVDTDIICLESGLSPDTNVIYISGGNYKQAYVKDTTTTSQVYLNCQTQDPAANAYAIEINGTRGSFIKGELRIINHGALICGEDAGFAPTSGDFIKLDLVVHSALDGGVPIFDFRRANRLEGTVTIATNDAKPFVIGSVTSANIDMVVQDNNYVGNLFTFGSQTDSLSASGTYNIAYRGGTGSATMALFDRVGDINVRVESSALPIVVSSTVSSRVISLDLPRGYVANNVPITHNGVLINASVRGLVLTSELLAYLAAVTPSGIPRGMNAVNVNTNGLNFFDGTVWKYATTTTTLT